MMIKSGMGLTLAISVFVLCAFCAGWLAQRLIRGNRTAVISSLPLVVQQTVVVELPGEFVVSVEVPRMATDYREWEFEVTEERTKRSHLMKWGGPRSTGAVTGISTVKVPLGRLTLAQPDQLSLRVKGLASDANYSAYRIVLARPHLLRMAVQITGLALCGMGMLLCLIWGLWLMGVVKAS
jgi:hypothetical protein